MVSGCDNEARNENESKVLNALKKNLITNQCILSESKPLTSSHVYALLITARHSAWMNNRFDYYKKALIDAINFHESIFICVRIYFSAFIFKM